MRSLLRLDITSLRAKAGLGLITAVLLTAIVTVFSHAATPHQTTGLTPAITTDALSPSIARGAYLAKAAGCQGCHTDKAEGAIPFAGGRALKTPFGTFYGPNITPDPQNGIGQWSLQDFTRALRLGQRPDGAHYFPAFPYTSFTQISDNDVADLWAYFKSLPPNKRANSAHEISFPFQFRFLVTIWQWLYFKPGAFEANPQLSPEINRGAYLTNALGHCTECHTPRNRLGASRNDRFLAGGMGPEGKNVPNLTPARLKKQWNDAELNDFLSSGQTPDGDVPAEAMREVINNSTGQLTKEDLKALIAYLRSLPALPEEKKEK